MRRRGLVPQGSGPPDPLVPLLTPEGHIHGATEDRVERPLGRRPVELGAGVLTDGQPGHQTVAQQVTQAAELIGIPRLVHTMFLGP